MDDKSIEYGNPECKDCVYSCILSRYHSCDYLFIVGTRRPCPPGKLCTVKKVDERKPRAMTVKSKGRPLDLKVEEQRLELYNQGLNDREIAERQGVSAAAIARWREKRGFCKDGRRITRNDFSDRMELYNKGLSDGQIAKTLGMTQGAISQWRRREGLPALYEQHSRKRVVKE